jgi:hypothetical protein
VAERGNSRADNVFILDQWLDSMRIEDLTETILGRLDKRCKGCTDHGLHPWAGDSLGLGECCARRRAFLGDGASLHGLAAGGTEHKMIGR